ncbi:MAG: hypothetical protein JNK82_04605 [Myxococcaceae bacterium]|nr:hypothetical protein [Myxococcaceae bacterium]
MLALVLIAVLGTGELANPSPKPGLTVGEKPAALESHFRLTLELGAAFTTLDRPDLGAAVDFGWLPIKYLRLHAAVGGAMLPASLVAGAFRLEGGVDGVLPFASGELFMGLESGVTYTNAGPGCPFCFIPVTPYEWKPSLGARLGVDITTLRPLVVGATVAYSTFSERFGGDTHTFGFQGRLGFAF